MPAVDVALIGIEDDFAAVRGQCDELYFELAGGEQGGRAAIGRDAIEMSPAVAFPREDEAVTGGPPDLMFCSDLAEDAARTLLRLPDFTALAGGGVGNANRPGFVGAARAVDASLAVTGLTEKRDVRLSPDQTGSLSSSVAGSR